MPRKSRIDARPPRLSSRWRAGSGSLTQQQLAKKLETKKSAISRIENHAEDIKLSTLDKFAQALGKTLLVEVA
jgi:transcriptional regulator with XRE-family HTH domain